MKQGLLENEYDPMGAAIRDYYETAEPDGCVCFLLNLMKMKCR